MTNFTMDAIDRALKADESITGIEMEESKSDKSYPETIFTDAELCKIIRNFSIKFNSKAELIEVCLVSITITSWLLPTHRNMSAQLDYMLQKNLQKLLQDKS